MAAYDDEQYHIAEVAHWHSTYYPRKAHSAPVLRVPSDAPNSEPSEKALEDLEKDRDEEHDEDEDAGAGYPSDEADYGEKSDEDSDCGFRPTIHRPTITTSDASTDTSQVNDHNTISTVRTVTLHTAPRNEILYLQVLTNGTTRNVNKVGVWPTVCYVDASTNTPRMDKDGVEVEVDALGKRTLSLKLEEPPPLVIRKGEENRDDFLMEG